MSHPDFSQTLDLGLTIPTAQTEEVHYALPRGRANRRCNKSNGGGRGGMRVSSVVAVHRVKHNKLGQTSIFNIVYLRTLLLAM